MCLTVCTCHTRVEWMCPLSVIRITTWIRENDYGMGSAGSDDYRTFHMSYNTLILVFFLVPNSFCFSHFIAAQQWNTICEGKKKEYYAIKELNYGVYLFDLATSDCRIFIILKCLSQDNIKLFVQNKNWGLFCPPSLTL